mmetsp:Transcript_5148/g.8737  ORF Transcript_5148/g.8737 Transcript_5148/m.8737 type:complete len:220 (+) Transcript_5148:191-850(+)
MIVPYARHNAKKKDALYTCCGFDVEVFLLSLSLLESSVLVTTLLIDPFPFASCLESDDVFMSFPFPVLESLGPGEEASLEVIFSPALEIKFESFFAHLLDCQNRRLRSTIASFAARLVTEALPSSVKSFSCFISFSVLLSITFLVINTSSSIAQLNSERTNESERKTAACSMTTFDRTIGDDVLPLDTHSTADIFELKVPRGATFMRVATKLKYSAAAV